LPAEVPVTHVTNGVHAPTWVAPEIASVGASPIVPGADAHAAGAGVSDRELWRVRETLRRRLLDEARRRLRRSSAERDDPPELLQRLLAGLDEEALLIGFARRFAPYKRADLLLRQPVRLRELLERADRPVRILFAGKAHPSDGHGQEILRRLVRASLGDELGGLVFFLEDYNIELARFLVQGVDLWLNTPTPPLEASGTSGMKAAMNGVLNLSVLDGWWAEAWDEQQGNGWAIVADDTGDGPQAVDDLDGDTTLRLLEREIAPLFFDRDGDGVPRRWLEKVRRSLATLSTRFDTRRMLEEYRDRAYLPAAAGATALRERAFRGAREAVWRNRGLRRGFALLRIVETTLPDASHYELGDQLVVAAKIEVDGLLTAEDLAVDLVVGPCRDDGGLDLARAKALPMRLAGEPAGAEPAATEANPAQATAAGNAVADGEPSALVYRVTLPLEHAGRFAWSVRVRPREDGPPNPALADLVVWG
jgi:starch phosphorylase